ncbi:PAS domain S-box-containing protein [Lachnospiraceae bacterium XBB1006]|nr:PAS domain S-box-containing protein [Lachnospiraceae bacterium XBB1006]
MRRAKEEVYASGDALFENLLCGLAQFRLYSDGSIYVERINPEAIRIFGKEPGENNRAEVNIRELLNYGNQDETDKLVHMLIEKEGRLTFEYPIARSGEEPTWITGVVQCLGLDTDEKGTFANEQVSFMNITATRSKLEQALQAEEAGRVERERNAEFFFDVFNRLYETAAGTEDVDNVLSLVGKYLDVDRVCVYEEELDEAFCNNTYEWCAEGILKAKGSRQHLPFKRSFAQKIVGDAGYAFCADVRVLPEESRTYLEKVGCRSLFLCGIYNSEKDIVGYIGLESCKRCRPEWEKEGSEREMVIHAGHLLANYIGKIRNIAHNALYRRRLLETERRVDAQTEAIAALGKAYMAVFRCDLSKNTAELVAGDRMDRVPDEVPKIPQELFDSFIERQVSVLYREEMYAFLDTDTMLERMKNTTMLNHDYQSLTGRWIRSSLIYGGDEVILFAVNSIEDERQEEREYQRQLKEVRRRENLQLKTIMDSIPGGFKITRDDGHFTLEYMSPRLIEMLGYSLEEEQEILNRHITNYIHPEDRLRVYEEIVSQSRNADSMYLKYRMLRKDGSSFWIEDIGHKVVFDDGEVKHYSVILDVDEAERHSIALQKANQTVVRERRQYRDALTKNALWHFQFDVTDGIIREDIVDVQGVNYMRNVGLKAPIAFDEFFGKMCCEREEVLAVDNPEALRTQYLLQSFEEGRTNVEVEFCKHQDNTYYRTNTLLSKDEETGHIIGFVLCRDITEQRREEERAKQALKDAYEAANYANRAKTDFLSKMSHDIRTPMNAIMGMTQIAMENLSDKEHVRDCLNKIVTSSDHLLGLINEVLDMSRVESGKMVLKEEPFNLREMMNHLLDMTKSGLDDHEHTLTIHTVDVGHENVIGDGLRMEQILVNILNNAIKYTPNGGQIDICIREKITPQPGIGYYEFSIADNGIGMSEAFQNILFEPFSREEDDRINKIQGTGLGMAIAKNIIQMMNGDIRVESKVGEGSRFTVYVYLRYANREERRMDDHREKQKAVRFEGKRLLVVEDNTLNREIICKILELRGLTVEEAVNGKEAVEMFAEHPEGYYDMILMDIQMPVMNGHEATRAIREMDCPSAKRIPIIAMTANAFVEDVQASKDAGMNEHLAKPLDMRKLTDVLMYYFDKK